MFLFDMSVFKALIKVAKKINIDGAKIEPDLNLYFHWLGIDNTGFKNLHCTDGEWIKLALKSFVFYDK